MTGKEAETLIGALSPAERFALRMRRWADDAEDRGESITPEDVQFALDEFGLYFPASLIEADRG